MSSLFIQFDLSSPGRGTLTAAATSDEFNGASPGRAIDRSNCGSATIKCCTHVGTASGLKSVLTPLFVSEGLISGLLVTLGLVNVLSITAGIVGSVNAVLGLTCSSIPIGGSWFAARMSPSTA
ncbi:hypothetical protein BDN71DRAFT_1507115 [Pleurotus eryngii]|uniref:Hydrophobin n=1 Tax=Pleurotus eryngii TaxID=5323 RepID=A0A9P5ZYF9_PLEER|nr:hypothetical protein BDN71DRAFT_1507115 [Pleurotus eryngii]